LRAKTLEEFDKIEADLDFYSQCFEMNPCRTRSMPICQFTEHAYSLYGWLVTLVRTILNILTPK
jgi:hypothetical protein